MTYLCTGSHTTRAANRKPLPPRELSRLEQINWRYTSGDCMDCLHHFTFVEDPNPRSDRLVLPMHYPNGKLVVDVLAKVLEVSIGATTGARHLEQIRRELGR